MNKLLVGFMLGLALAMFVMGGQAQANATGYTGLVLFGAVVAQLVVAGLIVVAAGILVGLVIWLVRRAASTSGRRPGRTGGP